jgi:hypothetical protein
LSASTISEGDAALAAPATQEAAFGRADWRTAALYLSISFAAGALIALQLAIMRVFAIGSWAHFGSLVVSLAMLGFGLSSAGLCAVQPLVRRWADRIATTALVLFAPLLAAAHLLAQQTPFNAVFMLADPQQKWRLMANFALYLLPFLTGATFLGTVFTNHGDRFARLYFADLSGAGLCGVVFMLGLCVVAPEDVIAVPLFLSLTAAALWTASSGGRGGVLGLIAAAAACIVIQFALPSLFGVTTLAVSDFKGVSYAQKLPDARQVLHRLSPFGDLQAYSSSYLHFAPGLSDNAGFNLTRLPDNAYLGLYLDGDGPIGIIRDLPAAETAYFTYLPMVYPYLIKPRPAVFIAEFGGGISTALALRSGAHSVTVAESNPVIIDAFIGDSAIGAFTGWLLQDKRVTVIVNAGRSVLEAAVGTRYDIVDLSFADSTGLSNPGGFSVVERFAYTREAMLTYMRALKPGGILAVTLWNKEEPPKSALKLYATMVDAARVFEAHHIADSFFAVSGYLSTTTVLYKNGGFSSEETTTLRAHTESMSFDALYYPGIANELGELPRLLTAYRNQIFGDEAADDAASGAGGGETAMPSTRLARLVWDHLVHGDWTQIATQYVFDTIPLTDNRPYFAGYIRLGDLPRVLDRLDILQDEWGYLLLWVTLGVSAAGALLLITLPASFARRSVLLDRPGDIRVVLYFACLGAGYIAVEVGLVSKFVLALGNYTISAAVVITSMLVFSGLGSLLSQCWCDRMRFVLPRVLGAIGLLLFAEAACIDRALEWVGTLPSVWRPFCCAGLILLPALLMGSPMPLAMAALARQGRDRVFIWAWGVNGCFSVVGAALVPIVATALGLNAVLAMAASAYLAAVPAVRAVFPAPVPAAADGGA